ncbi:MAG: hypothetical protein VB118_10235 [Oscillospiraceae bacterium]|nr:hypothetical protein [Oscillospiraceae bacterium]
MHFSSIVCKCCKSLTDDQKVTFIIERDSKK